jgi:hypothetical protein
VSVLALVPLALGETWFAVFGGLIPIVGLVLIGAVIWHAVQPPRKRGDSDDDQGPT